MHVLNSPIKRNITLRLLQGKNNSARLIYWDQSDSQEIENGK